MNGSQVQAPSGFFHEENTIALYHRFDYWFPCRLVLEEFRGLHISLHIKQTVRALLSVGRRLGHSPNGNVSPTDGS